MADVKKDKKEKKEKKDKGEKKVKKDKADEEPLVKKENVEANEKGEKKVKKDKSEKKEKKEKKAKEKAAAEQADVDKDAFEDLFADDPPVKPEDAEAETAAAAAEGAGADLSALVAALKDEDMGPEDAAELESKPVREYTLPDESGLDSALEFSGFKEASKADDETAAFWDAFTITEDDMRASSTKSSSTPASSSTARAYPSAIHSATSESGVVEVPPHRMSNFKKKMARLQKVTNATIALSEGGVRITGTPAARETAEKLARLIVEQHLDGQDQLADVTRLAIPPLWWDHTEGLSQVKAVEHIEQTHPNVLLLLEQSSEKAGKYKARQVVQARTTDSKWAAASVVEVGTTKGIRINWCDGGAEEDVYASSVQPAQQVLIYGASLRDRVHAELAVMVSAERLARGISLKLLASREGPHFGFGLDARELPFWRDTTRNRLRDKKVLSRVAKAAGVSHMELVSQPDKDGWTIHSVIVAGTMEQRWLASTLVAEASAHFEWTANDVPASLAGECAVVRVPRYLTWKITGGHDEPYLEEKMNKLDCFVLSLGLKKGERSWKEFDAMQETRLQQTRHGDYNLCAIFGPVNRRLRCQVELLATMESWAEGLYEKPEGADEDLSHSGIGVDKVWLEGYLDQGAWNSIGGENCELLRLVSHCEVTSVRNVVFIGGLLPDRRRCREYLRWITTTRFSKTDARPIVEGLYERNDCTSALVPKTLFDDTTTLATLNHKLETLGKESHTIIFFDDWEDSYRRRVVMAGKVLATKGQKVKSKLGAAVKAIADELEGPGAEDAAYYHSWNAWNEDDSSQQVTKSGVPLPATPAPGQAGRIALPMTPGGAAPPPMTPAGPGVRPPATPAAGVPPPATPAGPGRGVPPPATPAGPGRSVPLPSTPAGPGMMPALPATPAGPGLRGIAPPATPAGPAPGVAYPATPVGPMGGRPLPLTPAGPGAFASPATPANFGPHGGAMPQTPAGFGGAMPATPGVGYGPHGGAVPSTPANFGPHGNMLPATPASIRVALPATPGLPGGMLQAPLPQTPGLPGLRPPQTPSGARPPSSAAVRPPQTPAGGPGQGAAVKPPQTPFLTSPQTPGIRGQAPPAAARVAPPATPANLGVGAAATPFGTTISPQTPGIRPPGAGVAQPATPANLGIAAAMTPANLGPAAASTPGIKTVRAPATPAGLGQPPSVGLGQPASVQLAAVTQGEEAEQTEQTEPEEACSSEPPEKKRRKAVWQPDLVVEIFVEDEATGVRSTENRSYARCLSWRSLPGALLTETNDVEEDDYVMPVLPSTSTPSKKRLSADIANAAPLTPPRRASALKKR
eukprot:TRINITY_DN3356_c2_g1_i1.p1 TRINITY_DN3356_c2_g1~~TRINITY_DN3356_c2_g1_i1.p1  ORF type:complete len:1316 (+),score=288.19 TRINITY_DN3356_c2_g1_i1:119-4066(+)